MRDPSSLVCEIATFPLVVNFQKALGTKFGLHAQVVCPHPQPLSQYWERGARDRMLFSDLFMRSDMFSNRYRRAGAIGSSLLVVLCSGWPVVASDRSSGAAQVERFLKINRAEMARLQTQPEHPRSQRSCLGFKTSLTLRSACHRAIRLNLNSELHEM